MVDKGKKILLISIVTIFLLSIILILKSDLKSFQKITYEKINEYFTKNTKYNASDLTSQYDVDVRKFIEYGEGNIQIFYIEFSNKKYAKKYVENNYLNDKNNKVKTANNCTYIKNTKGKYMKLYMVDNEVVIGQTKNMVYKNKLNKVLKELGY